jgi:hypothetical protein
MLNALRRRLLKLATLLGALTFFWACNAPFIPVPPPGATFTSELVDDGMGGQITEWTTHGLPSANAAGALFFIINTRLEEGVIIRAADDGTYTSPPFEGVVNDQIRISYSTPTGDNYSDSICLLLTTDVTATGSAPLCPPSP